MFRRLYIIGKTHWRKLASKNVGAQYPKTGYPRWGGAVLPPQKIFDFFDIEMVHLGGFWVL
jgi:hypothetical protein